MSETVSISSLKKLFRFPFQDSQWQGRFLIGSAFLLANSIVPIIPGILVSGYVLRVMRQAIAGQEPSLPAWEDWDELLKDGLRATLVGLVYFLPGILIFVAGLVGYYVVSLSLPLAAQNTAEPSEFMVPFLTAMFGSMAILFVSMFVGTLLCLLGAVAFPLATAHFVAQDSVGAAFRVRQWWRVVRADKLGFFICFVVAGGLMGVLYLGSTLAYYTVVLCCLIPILTAPASLYVLLVSAALFGQTYRESIASQAAPEQEI